MLKRLFSRRKKESWTRFGGKVLLVSILASSGFLWFIDNYRIGRDAQFITSIENVRWYLKDLNDREIKRGVAYAIASKDLMPIYPAGTQMVKFLAALPGDTVKVDAEGVWVNGELVATGFKAAERLGLDKRELFGERTLEDDEYWFLGNSPESFDSRYWGSVSKKNILNRAYPLESIL